MLNDKFDNNESKSNALNFAWFLIVYQLGSVVINRLEKNEIYNLNYIGLRKAFISLTLLTYVICFLINIKKINRKDRRFVIFLFIAIAISGYILVM